MLYYKNDCDSFDYEFEDVIKLFFLKEELKKINGPWDQSSGGFLFCRPDSNEKGKSINIRLQGKDFDESTCIILPEEFSSGNKSKLKSFKKIFKRKLFLLLQNYTGKIIPWGVMTGIRPTKLVNELLDGHAGKDRIIDTLTKDYFVTGNKAEQLYKVAVNQRELFGNSDSKSVSLYVGIPFCPTRCLYCSFSSSTLGQYKKVVDTYLNTLLMEIEHTAGLIKENGFNIESIYIGGGTPTSINPIQLDRLLKGIEDSLDLSFLREYTLEAGRPDTIDAEKLKVIKDSRVTRISINPQSMNTATLERIGRNHTPADVEKAFFLARELGFDNINMDVICGLPGEDVSMFKATMDRIAQLNPESITVHTMAIKRASRLTLEMDKYNLHKEYEQVAEMVETAQEYAASLGLEPYYLYRQKNILGNLENVGYSQKGKECLYNIQIMEERQSIFACGAGAVTKMVFPENRIERSFNVKSVEEYIGRIDEMFARTRTVVSGFKTEIRTQSHK
ncbi:MAG: coproporphyrinogen dehydrogenase HemZ [Eubacterium sp.]|jgi:oxygen-independent coproporphyrinogen-3 oxidase|nr:coproporphyrinogen dehydrogenase HemZ [Eubacterium sp.]